MKKILLYFLGIVAMSMISPTFVHAFDTDLEGAGTETDPYLIQTLKDLKELSNVPEFWYKDIYFKQMANITLPAPTEWEADKFTNLEPIGRNNNEFNGTYDGNGYFISGLTVQAPLEDDGTLPENPYTTIPYGEDNRSFGLFTNTNGATIKGVVLKDVSFYFETLEGVNVCIGGLIGKDIGNTTVTDCSVEGRITGYDCVGGLIGNSNFDGGSVLSGCVAEVSKVSGTGNVGGLVGIAKNMIITKSVVKGTGTYADVSGKDNVGGFIGSAMNPAIECCYSLNTIDLNVTVGDNTNIGTFIGNAEGGSITDCFASTSNNQVGDDFHHFLGNSEASTTAMESCFENSITSGEIDTDAGLISLSADLMKDPSYYIYKGWDFETIWGVSDEGYPTLHDIARLEGGATLPFLWVGSDEGNTTWFSPKAWYGEQVPTLGDAVYIPAETTCKINTELAECSKLVVAEGATLNIEYDIYSTTVSSGQLYVEESSMGVVNYKVFVPGPVDYWGDYDFDKYSGWHYISSPVLGQGIMDFVTDVNNAIPTNNSQYALGILDQDFGKNFPSDDGNLHMYYPKSGDTKTNTGDPINDFIPGVGYTIMRNSPGFITFTGEVNTEPVTVTSYAAASTDEAPERWAYIGNPYTVAIDGWELYDDISDKLCKECRALYIWDVNEGEYVAYNYSTGVPALAPCQAFHIHVQAGGNTITMETSDALLASKDERVGAMLKSGTISTKFHVELALDNGSKRSKTSVYFIDDKTNGLDPGWDAASHDMANTNGLFLATELVETEIEESEDHNHSTYQIQALSADAVRSSKVPLVVHNDDAMSLTISINDLDIPEDVLVYIFDKELGYETELTKESPYTFEVGDLDTEDRFVLNLKSITAVDGLGDDKLSVIPMRESGSLLVKGIEDPTSTLTVYSISGQVVFKSNLQGTSVEYVSVGSEMPRGLYLVQIQSGSDSYTEKIRW